MFRKSNIKLSLAVFVFTAIILSIVQLKLDNPIIILERFIKGGGWIEIFIISFYGALVAYKMQNTSNVVRWRRYTWTLFSVAFFLQLILGLVGFEKFLMTGRLHLPIPVMILSGPVYRGQISIMTILFLSTILLSGPAWCSHLCYFGALDGLAAKGKTEKGKIKNKLAVKYTFLLFIIAITLILRWLGITLLVSTIAAISFGVLGIIVIVVLSAKKGKMYHCILYCPLSTVVNYLRFINPFRLYIDQTCTLCMKCTGYCKYDALNTEDIKRHKPAVTCTLCGDCLSSCKENSIKYRFLKFNPGTSRNLYLFITISIHAVFLALARI